MTRKYTKKVNSGYANFTEESINNAVAYVRAGLLYSVSAAVAASHAFQRSEFLLSTMSFRQLLPMCFAVLCAS